VVIATIIMAVVHSQCYRGVNLSGLEFGQGNLPGQFNKDYTVPTNAEVDYFTGKGMNSFRLPYFGNDSKEHKMVILINLTWDIWINLSITPLEKGLM